MRRVLFATLATALAGCPIPEREALFPGAVDGVPGIAHLGEIEPTPLTTLDEVRDAVIYGEIGPTGNAQVGGLTVGFKGNGGDVCVWIDPETVSWSQSVAPAGGSPAYRFPDNTYDDGDLDLSGGLSVYYSGVPGDTIGAFQIEYVDSLGEIVPVDLVECFIEADLVTTASHAGRAMPEYCTITNTVANIDYTVLLETYSTPIDDRRLGFGMLLTEGPCEDLADLGRVTLPSEVEEECLITGESIKPGADQGTRAAELFGDALVTTWIGSEVPTWEFSVALEQAFCREDLAAFCGDEQARIDAGQLACSWEIDPSEGGDRCYCGDVRDTPRPGAF